VRELVRVIQVLTTGRAHRLERWQRRRILVQPLDRLGDLAADLEHRLHHFLLDLEGGNLTGDGTNSYTWDVRNRLAAISGALSASFAYDALGRRSARTVSGTTVKYLHDGLNVVQRQDAGGSPTAQMLMGGLDEIFGEVTATGTTSYFTDALGSTVALTDGSRATNAEFTYEPYGKNSKTGAGDTPFRYTGRDDDGTGLYYYRARYYHPQLGRFVAEDPIGLAGGINLYAYVGGNPLSYVDPLGLDYFDLNVSIGAGIGVTAGVVWNNDGMHPYAGAGIMTPGATGSLTWSSFDPTPGWTTGVQAQAGGAWQAGYSWGNGENSGVFTEAGVGLPWGASWTGYYIFDSFDDLFDWITRRKPNCSRDQ
jgi:RHS repeat-associated protein